MGRFLDRLKERIDSLPDRANDWLKKMAGDALKKVSVPTAAVDIIKRITGGDNLATDIVELSAWSMLEVEHLAAARPATNWTSAKKRKVAAALLCIEVVSENLLPPRMSDAQAEELLQALIDSAMAHEMGGHLAPPTPDEDVPTKRRRTPARTGNPSRTREVGAEDDTD